jgi:hypothetical protein
MVRLCGFFKIQHYRTCVFDSIELSIIPFLLTSGYLLSYHQEKKIYSPTSQYRTPFCWSIEDPCDEVRIVRQQRHQCNGFCFALTEITIYTQLGKKGKGEGVERLFTYLFSGRNILLQFLLCLQHVTPRARFTQPIKEIWHHQLHSVVLQLGRYNT